MANPYHTARQVRALLIDHEGSVEVCFVQCIDCLAEETLSQPGGTASISDSEARSYFRRRGWTVLPTRCPRCAASAAQSEGGTSMTDYGGIGGIMGGRPLNEQDAFEMAVARQLGAAMREDRRVGVEVWSALANMDWAHENGDTASYSFRAAGDLVAAVVGAGDYLDWYCSGPYATVSARVATALAREGWHGVPDTGRP